ncbi:hypothetical protein B0H21DRAFT_689847 [Amylocystis lapponica]|nr:hypothetical protein B0H21DRAFT_689847 [Amylocystis lapponica]
MKAVMNKLSGKPSPSSLDIPDLHGRTAVVTGGTDGIGLEIARTLALARARILLISNQGDHASEAIRDIKKSQDKGAGPIADVTFIECDLGSLKHVKKVADQIREQEPRLDLLICNAGVGVNKLDGAACGLDRHFAVNHLGHFLLTNRLLPLLRRTAAHPNAPAARIVCMSSSLHATAPSSVAFASREEVASNGEGLGAMGLYARSKLANLLFVKYGLAPRTGPRVLALATDPGAVHTGQQDQFKEAYGDSVGEVLKRVVVPFMRAPAEGAASMVWAATSEEVECDAEKWHGRYVTDPGEDGKESAMACDKELGARLWELSAELVEDELGKDGLLSWNEGEENQAK